MFWMRKAACQVGEWRVERARWRADMERYKAARRAARKSGGRIPEPENPGPPPTGFSLLPWLLMGLGSFSNLLQGRTPLPWIGAVGLLTFNSLYIYVTFRAFTKKTRDARSTRVALAVMGAVTCALAIVYGGSWLYFFPLLGLATGAVMRGPWLGRTGLSLTALAAAVSAVREGWDALNVAYGTFLSTMVTAAILSLTEAVRELRAAREELARRAVEEERLRFSRDLHDLLGHTLSVIVVKSEAARRLAPRDMDAALLQITDIESVGRQALTEIREAVTGYRQGSLATELDRADSVLTAADVTPVIHRSGPPLSPAAEALLGWVVREAVTNVVRHSIATRCEITVEGTTGEGTGERVRLCVADNGTGPKQAPTGSTRPGVGGTGLRGLTERLAAAGGSLEAGPTPGGGFLLTAELPPQSQEPQEPPSSQLNAHIRPTLTP
ncbi:sensor histidine kinase [Streptomyces sp. NBC_00576]|uniref:sensor histidine kinase n=1 Tax=Streptomyces sp. NBC_00576 TaxID=2903665 RepID=UPI002E80B152|nr:sensor histidine kinase [Streptomyces sp. NBC_00576]WUB74868.1 sensor histidine kinase [Streptomyces sp. NBC_00576]